MSAGYEIRRAGSADVEGVVALERELETAPHWTVADYLGALRAANSKAGENELLRCFFVASADEMMMGFAVGRVVTLDADVSAELESVGVAVWARRQGVGRALCQAVIEWACGHGAGEIELEVRSRSDGAMAVYRGLGFAVAGRRAGYYRAPEDDAVLMR